MILSPASLAFAEGHGHSCGDVLASGFENHAALLPPQAESNSTPEILESGTQEEVIKAESIWISGKASNRLDLVFLGDGYTASEEKVFREHVDLALEAFFNEEPFKSFKNLINVHIVFKSSNQSGVDNDPTNGVDNDTALDMRFWCFGSQRGLCVDIDKAKELAELAPAADQIIVAANSTSYGGIGYTSNDVATFSGGNVLARELLLHEFGHSFGNLADEYDGVGISYQGEERTKANVSILSKEEMSQEGTKWAAWLDFNPGEIYGGMVSTYEGGDLFSEGVFRPSYNSKMRSLGQPFNMPSIEALVVEIYGYVSPIDQVSHQSGEVEFLDTIFVDPVDPLDHSIKIEWLLDGEVIEDQTDWFLSPRDLEISAGSHTISARVVEMTDFVRNEETRDNHLTDTFSWIVEVPEISPNSDIDNDGYSASEELEAGSDPYESSSMPADGQYQTCSFPNGFLEQVNVLNLINNDASSVLAEISYYADNGVLVDSVAYNINSGQKLDVSLFELGLKPNTVGTVCVSSSSRKISGGLSVYAPNNFGAFDFALYYPLEQPSLSKSSSLSLNTFNLVPGEPGAFNWIRLIDGQLGDGFGLTGLVQFFDLNGNSIEEFRIDIADGARIDISGHDILGANAYGLVTFKPDSSEMGYFFEVTRYFPKSLGGFYSAVPILKGADSSKPDGALVSLSSDLQDILEITNSGDIDEDVFLMIRNSVGQAVKTEVITVPAKGSFHKIVSELELNLDEMGAVFVISESKEVKTKLLSYRFDQNFNFFSASSLALHSQISKELLGQFNSFLNQSNHLNLYNAESDPAVVEVSLEDYLGQELARYTINLEPRATRKLTLPLGANTYGSIKVSSDKAILAQSELKKDGDFVLLNTPSM